MMKIIALITCALIFVTQPCFSQSAGDVLQIQGKSFNARTSIYFQGKNNVAFTLTSQDVAEIIDVRILPSGNKALRIGVISGPNVGKKAWIYYDVKQPEFEVFTSTMESFDLAQESVSIKTPAASTKRPISAQRPIKVEVERIKPTRDEVAVGKLEDLTEYDQHFLSMLEKYEQEIDQKGSESLLDKAKEALSGLVEGKTSQQEYCAECQDFISQSPLNEINFEQCSSNNSDLESNFKTAYDSAMSSMKNDVNTQDFATALKCINGGMKGSMTGTGGFYNCPSPRSFLKEAKRKASTKPCLSKNMVGSTAAEIYLAAKCLGQDLNRVLPLLRHESRFIPNVRSVTGAGGIGQLTGIAIKEINRNLSRYTSQYGSRPGCEYLKKVPKMHDGFICSRMHIPTNPRQNAVFSIIYQKLLRDNKALNPLKSVNKWLDRRSSSLTKNQKAQVEEMLLRTSYNSGPGAVLTAFNSFAASPTFRNLPYNQFMKSFSSYLRRNVRDEAANYNDKVLKDLKVMEQNAGIKCSI